MQSLCEQEREGEHTYYVVHYDIAAGKKMQKRGRGIERKGKVFSRVWYQAYQWNMYMYYMHTNILVVNRGVEID